MYAQETIRNFRKQPLLLLLVSCSAAFASVIAGGCITSPSDTPPPPSGGQKLVLDYAVFSADIDSILTDNGCDNLACHGGGIRGTFELSPVGNKDVAFDFAQSALQVDANDAAASALLMKPLAEAAGGAAHAGSTQSGFADMNDPGYQAILAWIEAGVTQ